MIMKVIITLEYFHGIIILSHDLGCSLMTTSLPLLHRNGLAS